MTSYLRNNDGHLLPMPGMRLIPGGEFTMGDTETPPDSEQFHRDETPRRVRLESFYISQFPVTKEEFCIFLNNRPTEPPARGIRGIQLVDGVFKPVRYHDRVPVCVSYTCAAAYCQWLSEETGLSFRLPTEEEWEFAARGPESADWPWRGEAYRTVKPISADVLESWGWRKLRKRPPPGPVFDVAAPVGAFACGQTPEGVYGLMGDSLGEWCGNEWTEPMVGTGEPSPPNMRVIRGHTRRDRERVVADWLSVILLSGDGAYSTHHDAHVWTRIGGDEERNPAFFRLVLDGEF